MNTKPKIRVVTLKSGQINYSYKLAVLILLATKYQKVEVIIELWLYNYQTVIQTAESSIRFQLKTFSKVDQLRRSITHKKTFKTWFKENGRKLIGYF